MNSSQLVASALLQEGITTVFGYPGGAIMPIYDALYDGGVEHILCRHEQGLQWQLLVWLALLKVSQYVLRLLGRVRLT